MCLVLPPLKLCVLGDPFRPFFATSDVSENTEDVKVQLHYEMAAELLAMSLGKHVYFLSSLLRPESYDHVNIDASVDREQHLIAMTIVQLLQQLGTMEEMDNFISDTVNDIFNTEKTRVNYTRIFYGKCDSLKDFSIYEEFVRTKEQMSKKYESLPEIRGRLNEINAPNSILAYVIFVMNLYDQYIDIRRLILSTDFLETAISARAQPRYQKMANAWLKWSRDLDLRQEVERIYKDVLYEVTDDQNPDYTADVNVFLERLNTRLKNSSLVDDATISEVREMDWIYVASRQPEYN